MTTYDKLFIGGQWAEPASDKVLEVFSPATGEKVACHVPAQPRAMSVPPPPWTRSKYGKTLCVARPSSETNSFPPSVKSCSYGRYFCP